MLSSKELPRLLIIDTNALAHRAFHAFPLALTTKSGQVVNALYGFGSMLLQVLNTYRPDYLICAQDSKELTFRHELYEKYKANRPKMDDLLVQQIILISELIDSLNIPRIAVAGFEADDIIGSLVHSEKLDGLETIIVTGDKDLLQVLKDNIKVYLPQSTFSKAVLYDKISAAGKLGFETDHLIEFKALRGDLSDNIPGVKGIGEKTATVLINEYHTLDNIYKNLDKIKPAIREKLIRDKKIAYISRELGKIKTDMDIDMDIKKAKLENLNYEQFITFCRKYEFNSLIKRIDPLMKIAVEKPSNKFVFSDHSHPNTVQPIMHLYLSSDQKTKRTVLMNKLLNSTEIAFDAVLSTKSDIFSLPVSLNFAFQNEVIVFPIQEIDISLQKNLKEILKSKKVVVYDAKKQLHALLNLGFTLSDINFSNDLLLTDYLLGAGQKQISIEDSMYRWLNKKIEQDQQASLFETERNYEHSFEVLLLNSVLKPLLEKEPKLLELKEKIELPLVRVLVEMERNGIKLDSDYLTKFSDELDINIAKLSKEIFSIAGVEFNLSSPKQLAVILSEKLKLPVTKKTKGGNISTNEKVLMNYINDYPIIDLILQYRELFKLKSTYTSTLISQINEKTGRIHTTFNQAVVATGRLSSKDPNMQNIPTSSELGQKIRNAFIADEGKVLVSFDYAQQELRLLAHLSKEEKLLDVFRNNIDIHTSTASALFNVPMENVTKEERRIGKTVNFGVIYGISGFGLGDQLKITTDDAQKFINDFYNSYPMVKVYFEELKAEARNLGYVETLFGRRKDASGLNNPNFQLRMGKEREIINFPLQGSAADLMKLAMIEASQYVFSLHDPDYKMVLQVHDEMIFEIPDDTKMITEFTIQIKQIMTGVCKLDIPFNVEANYAKRWGDLK